jgi:nucleotide-binding universal stress UspA family protein
LRYAAALAEHLDAGLIVLTVDTAFMADAAAAAMDSGFLERETHAALDTFVGETLGARRSALPDLRLDVAIGEPAVEILRHCSRVDAGVIVMSTHGTHGVRKAMFGSVTERVLRHTQLPVLVTPAADAGPEGFEQWQSAVRRLLVPVDFSDWTPQQVWIAQSLAESLHGELVFAHVLRKPDDPSRLEVHRRLDAIIRAVPAELRPAITIGAGDIAGEIVRIARERDAHLIVMGLHSSPVRPQHMGRITYDLLCRTPTVVLAWPPERLGAGLAPQRARDVVII